MMTRQRQRQLRQEMVVRPPQPHLTAQNTPAQSETDKSTQTYRKGEQQKRNDKDEQKRKGKENEDFIVTK